VQRGEESRIGWPNANCWMVEALVSATRLYIADNSRDARGEAHTRLPETDKEREREMTMMSTYRHQLPLL